MSNTTISFIWPWEDLTPAEIERWLEDEVGPAFDAVQADPTRAISVDDAFDQLRALHAACVAAGR
ncbi:hypothetical protein [Tistrella mobilis]|uniref:hypothetical protein n=1 Tax=Tistrella mobilis TaxID=171437 RepID=UPI003558EC3D